MTPDDWEMAGDRFVLAVCLAMLAGYLLGWLV